MCFLWIVNCTKFQNPVLKLYLLIFKILFGCHCHITDVKISNTIICCRLVIQGFKCFQNLFNQYILTILAVFLSFLLKTVAHVILHFYMTFGYFIYRTTSFTI